MKIISKYKDYYDYLQGLYGIDKKLILDRRDHDLIPYTPSDGKLTFYIAGYIIEGYWSEKEKKCYYGDDLKQFVDKIDYIPSQPWKRDCSKSIWLHNKNLNRIHNGDWYYIEPIKDKDKFNIKYNCPILLKFNSYMLKYIKLSDFNMASFISSNKMYEMLSEWLSKQITLKEEVPELNNDNKIKSKGFDIKKSFRPKMK